MTRPRLMAGVFLAASGRASTTPERDDAEQMRQRRDLPAFLEATGGETEIWCVRYDAETGPVRVPVRAEIETAALERASGTGAHDHARGDARPGEDPDAPSNAATMATTEKKSC